MVLDEEKKIEQEEHKIEKEEEETLETEKKLEAQEEKELKEIADSNINLEFENMDDWRMYIWDGCEFKKAKTEGDEMDFFCTKRNALCRFDGCPLNYKEKKSG
ncbi:MAG: hypothetical protein V1729_04055 [Candidatus Woesearchaeota archaeon]